MCMQPIPDACIDSVTPSAMTYFPSGSPEKIDLVVTLGGDGTILHASSLFSSGAVPPVLSFSMGTLGFLLPFHIDDFDKALESVFSSKATILNRMRLACTFYDSELVRKSKETDDWQVMNEIALHRGSSPHLNTIDIFVDGQHLTEAVIGDRSRAPAGISMDGRSSHTLSPGESVVVQASPFPVPCINRSSIITPSIAEQMRHKEGAGPGKEDDWVRDINNLLQYNATFRSKALLRHSRT
ncbi:hypothetical protein NLJ89_g8836 [Agrocybe chaxingu]|uniref:NAD(+) kinase n=1 Tax=Agrocybe chaxingu TaxID=84603 RepID=A0A9W8JWV1_9AGAR|nr:hypothetical protein NLJ89_g8836 [Agrocybe chaxingu]